MVPSVVIGQAIDWRRSRYADEVKQEATALWNSCRAYAEKHGRYPPDLAAVAPPDVAARYVYEGATLPRADERMPRVYFLVLFWSRDAVPGHGRLTVPVNGNMNYCPYDGWFRHELAQRKWTRRELGLPPMSVDSREPDPAESASTRRSPTPADDKLEPPSGYLKL